MFAVAAALGGLGVQLTNLGLHASNTYAVSHDRALLGPLLANSIALSLSIGGLAALGLGLFLLATGTAPVDGWLLAAALVSIPIGLAYLLMQNLMLGTQDVRGYNGMDIASRLAGLLLIAALIGLNLVRVEWIFVATVASSTAVVVFAWMRLVGATNTRIRPSASLFRRYGRYGLKAFIAALFAYLVIRVDILLVQYLRGPAEAGYYSLAVSLVDIVYILPVVTGSLMFPKLMNMPVERRLPTALRVAFGIFLVMTVASVAALVLGGPVIPILYGEAFIPSFWPFAWLLPGIVLLSANTILMNYLATIDNPSVVVFGPAAALVLNVVANLLLVPMYGAVGAAAASALAYGFLLAVTLAYLRTATRQ